MNQTIRIIGGRYRGKKIPFPDMDGLRPTPDRVKETLFNWLMHDIKGARCLDAFAGSGALSFEAYSRGAAKVVLIEQSAQAYRYLKQQVIAFNSDQLSVVQADACQYLRTSNESFDLIFLDPPYAKQLLPECIQHIEQTQILTDDGLLYVEADHAPYLSESTWECIKSKQAGQVTYGLYRKKSDSLLPINN